MNDHLSDLVLGEWLDGELSPVERLRAEAHVAHCAACALRRASLERLFARLAAAPDVSPSPALEGRILAAALPALRAGAARRERVWRWIGGLYAAGTAASLAAVASLFVLPAPRAWAHDVAAAGTHALAGAFVFVCRALQAGAVSVAGGASLWDTAFGRLAPVTRALGRIAGLPEMAYAGAAGLVTIAFVLWLLRPRPDRAWKEGHHVGVLVA